MIIILPEEHCANCSCGNKLKNGANIGGWKAVRTSEGNYISGYICKRCGNQSTVGTKKLRLFQRMHHYGTVKEETKHKESWQRLVTSLQKEDKKDEQKQNNGKTPG